MRRMASGVSLALVFALVAGSVTPLAAPGDIPIKIDQMSPGQLVEFSMNAGKFVKQGNATANDAGVASGVFDFANASKPQAQVDVYTFTCPEPPRPPKVVVKMVDHGAPAPDDPCGNRKMVGVFWLHQARAITIHLKDGTMDVTTANQTLRYGLIGGAAAVGVIAIVALTGDENSSTGTTPGTNPPATNPPATNPPATNPPATNPPTTAPPTTSGQTPFTDLNRLYNKIANRATNNCNFFVASFNGTLENSGIDANGQNGVLVETHSSGQQFRYRITLSRTGPNSFQFQTDTITSSIGGRSFRSAIVGTFSSPTSGTGTETFTDANGSCSDGFNETYTAR